MKINRRIIVTVVIGMMGFIFLCIGVLSVNKAQGAWIGSWTNLVIGTPLEGILGEKQAPQPSATDVLIDKLAQCESRGNNMAVNPNDLDNTPSYSTFQWKPSTWALYVKRYKLWNSKDWDEADLSNAMWDTQYQTAIVKKMFTDPLVDLRHEFPSCSKLLGLKKNYS